MTETASIDTGQTAFNFDRRVASAKRGMDRVGVIDIGSNSVRLVVFDGAARSPAYFYNEKIMAALGEDIAETGKLSSTGRARALAALERFRVLAQSMNAPLHAVATAAVRDATDGPDFCAEIERRTGIAVRVATGKEEARLSAQGVLLGWPEATGLVCDIGGASMELAEIGGGRVRRTMSSPLGPLKLNRLQGGQDAIDAAVDREIRRLRKAIDGQYETIYLVGGSWRAIARIDMERRDYPLKVVHEYTVPGAQMIETARYVQDQDPADLSALSGSSLTRTALVPTAGRVLERLIETFEPARLAASSYGIREGLLYQAMPDDLRRRDPMLEACNHMEANAARFPGFGKVLYSFLKPIFTNLPEDDLRLIKAACLLHDVTWRAHPDYRAEVCFDNATRANLGGLDHEGRVFLGMCLLHRYKASRDDWRFELVAKLLPEDRMDLAQVVGKAMRFGAMLSGSASRHMGALVLGEEPAGAGFIELKLPRDARKLYGEVVEDRFKSLAAAMNREHRVSVVR